MKNRFLLLLFLLVSLNSFSQIITENFNYGTNADSLTSPTAGGANWTRHSGGGNLNRQLFYNPSSLSYAGYPLSGVGGSAEIWCTTRSEDLNRSFTGVASGSFYVSFLLRVDSVATGSTTGDYFIHYCDTFGSTLSNFRGRVFIRAGVAANTFQIGLSKSTIISPVYTSDYAFTNTLLIVLKYKFETVTTLDDSAFAYVFTSGVPTTEPAAPTLVAPDNQGASDLGQIRSICLRQGGSTYYKAIVDGIRIGNSWISSAGSLATVSTNSPSSITANSAVLGGNVTNIGGSSVTERGVVYSTSANPTTANSKVVIGSGIGVYSQTVSGLTASTSYHVRSYAINSTGTNYGGDSVFTTLAASGSTINVTVGPGGTYTSFTNPGGLFATINASGLTQNTVARVIGNTNELGTHSLNQFSPNYSLTINPDAATLRTIEMVAATRASDSLFIFNGADNVIIDGSFNGSGKYLLFRCANANQDSTGSVFSLVNDAREISISNCIIESNSNKGGTAAITIGNSNQAWGNDGFTLYGNLIREATGINTGGYITALLNSPGFSANYVQRNSRTTIKNNQFTGFRSTTLGMSILNILYAGDSLIIDSNQFYRGSNFAISAIGNFYCITTDNGLNAIITNNSLGGSNPNRSGAPISVGGQFIGININSTDTGSLTLVKNNKISNIVGTRGGQSDINGMWVRADKIVVENNVIGGLENPWDTIQGGGVMMAVYIDGFNKPDTAFVRGNTISHIKYNGKVSKGLTGLSVSKIISNGPEYLVCHDNVISDMFSNSLAFSNGTSGALIGLNINLSPNGTRDVFVYNNTIKNLSHRTDTTRYNANHIAGLVFGLYCGASSSGTYKSKIYTNKIYNLSALNTNIEDTGLFSTQVSGIICYQISGGYVSIYNNQVSLVAPNTSAVRYFGISCKGNNTNFQGNLRIVNNSVLLNGNSGANGVNGYSSAFSRELKQTAFVHNNIFMNARTGSNINMAIVNDSLAANWTDTTCQNNLYVSSNSSQMGLWANRTNPLTFAAWKSASNSDTASTYYTSAVIDPANFFTNYAICDLSIKPAMRNYAAGKAYPESGVTVDYLGNARSSSTPSVGAFEYPYTTPPPAGTSIMVNQIIPEYGMVGSTVMIKGLGFNNPASDNKVLFGNILATIVSGNDSTLVVTVPLGAKASPLMVTNQANGLSARSEAVFRPMFAPEKINLTELDFLPAKAFGIAVDTRNIISADFDGDGKMDVAGVSTFYDSLVSVLRNTSEPGQITFATNVTYLGNRGMNRVYAQDLNGDGKPEIISSSAGSSGISIFPNICTLGTISFGSKIDMPTGPNPVTILFEDFDGNGKPDIIVANQLGDNLTLFRNTSTGTNFSFVSKNYPISFLGNQSNMGLTSNDFNHDGKKDLAVTFPFNNRMKILKNISLLDSIDFILDPVIYTTDTFIRDLQSADLNGDGKPEIITYASSDKKVSIFANIGTGSQIAFNDTFTYKAHQLIADLRVYNVDGDSLADLALYCGDSVVFLKNTSTAGNYNFVYFGSKYVNGSFRFEMADIDNDHKVDLLVTGGNNVTLRVFRHIYPISNNNIAGTEILCSASIPNQIIGSTVVNNYLIPFTHNWIKSSTSATTNYALTSSQDTLKDFQPGTITGSTWFKRVYIWDYTYDTTNVAAKTIANLGANIVIGNQQVNSGQLATTLTGSLVSGVTYLWLSSSDSLTGYAQASGTSTGKNYAPGLMFQTTYYKRIVKIGSCADTSLFVKVSVILGAINNQITSGNQLKCQGEAVDTLRANIPTGLTIPISYLWINSTVGATGPYTTAAGVNNQRNYFPGALVQTTWFRRIAMDATHTDTSNVVLITITASPAKPVISTKPVSPICLNTNTLNFGASTAAPAGVSYVWSAENALLYAQGSTKQFSLVTFNSSGKAKVILTASANGCSSKDEVEYDVTSEVSHQATVRYFNKNFVCEANLVNKYQWGYDIQPTLEGAILTGEINQNYFNVAPELASKNYWVISNTASCYQKTYYNKPLNVREYEFEENGLLVYPNPVGSQITVHHKDAKGSMQVQVLDMHGKICQEVFSARTETILNMEGLAPGVYMVRCVLENDVIVTTKVVKN
ncbi:MAG: hypothetical protein CFE21_10980 [Bacteroidetes bacterium B1(2017)]|nr:MAG: hypothetical protein CFE21_10980 [Bacteroidetes bacterium B1(2017)]